MEQDKKAISFVEKVPRRIVHRLEPKGGIEENFHYLVTQKNEATGLLQMFVHLEQTRESSLVFFTELSLGDEKFFLRVSWFEDRIKISEYLPYISENEDGNIVVLSLNPFKN